MTISRIAKFLSRRCIMSYRRTHGVLTVPLHGDSRFFRSFRAATFIIN